MITGENCPKQRLCHCSVVTSHICQADKEMLTIYNRLAGQRVCVCVQLKCCGCLVCGSTARVPGEPWITRYLHYPNLSVSCSQKKNGCSCVYQNERTSCGYSNVASNILHYPIIRLQKIPNDAWSHYCRHTIWPKMTSLNLKMQPVQACKIYANKPIMH